MRSTVPFQLGVLIAAGIFLAVWRGGWGDPLGRLGSWLEATEIASPRRAPVVVLLVGSRERVDEIRAAVHPDRVLAASADAFALVEGRIVAASIEAVSGPLNRAGWADRPLEIMEPGARIGAPAQPDPEGDPFQALQHKPYLTGSDSLRLLRAMESRGDL